MKRAVQPTIPNLFCQKVFLKLEGEAHNERERGCIFSAQVKMADDKTDQASRKWVKTLKKIVMDNLLVIFMIIGVIKGVALGLGLRNHISTDDKKTIFFLQFPGDLLLNMLKMLILPLIVSSLVSAMSGLKAQASGKMGLRTVLYYLITTFCAVVLGIILVVAIQPGYKREASIQRSGQSKPAEGLPSLLDLIR